MRINEPGASARIRALGNPLGYRIIAALSARPRQTTEQLAATLSDVPPSSLYRQLARLRRAELIRVVSERPARGTVERTYALASTDMALTQGEVKRSSLADLRASLRNFVTALAADTLGFIESRRFSGNRTMLQAYNVRCMLTDDDYRALLNDINALVKRAIKRRAKDDAGAKRRSLYFIALPETETP